MKAGTPAESERKSDEEGRDHRVSETADRRKRSDHKAVSDSPCLLFVLVDGSRAHSPKRARVRRPSCARGGRCFAKAGGILGGLLRTLTVERGGVDGRGDDELASDDGLGDGRCVALVGNGRGGSERRANRSRSSSGGLGGVGEQAAGSSNLLGGRRGADLCGDRCRARRGRGKTVRGCGRLDHGLVGHGSGARDAGEDNVSQLPSRCREALVRPLTSGRPSRRRQGPWRRRRPARRSRRGQGCWLRW